MKFVISLTIVLGLTLVAAGPGSLYALQEGDPAHNHIAHIMERGPGTPEGVGFLPIAVEEAEIAGMIADAASPASANRLGLRSTARQIMRCVDRSAELLGFIRGDSEGPCGRIYYGIRPAAAAIASHVQLAAESPGASQNVQTHANHVVASANNILRRADEIEALVVQVFAAETADAARPMVVRLIEMVPALLAGVDANGDGTIGWQEGEGGLAAVRQHMELMMKGEGLP